MEWDTSRIFCKKELLELTFWMGGRRLDSLWTASRVSMCIWTTPGIIWCRLRMWLALTPPSVHTLSTKRETSRITAVPVSPGSWSSKPDSASPLSLSATLDLQQFYWNIKTEICDFPNCWLFLPAQVCFLKDWSFKGRRIQPDFSA